MPFGEVAITAADFHNGSGEGHDTELVADVAVVEDVTDPVTDPIENFLPECFPDDPCLCNFVDEGADFGTTKDSSVSLAFVGDAGASDKGRSFIPSGHFLGFFECFFNLGVNFGDKDKNASFTLANPRPFLFLASGEDFSSGLQSLASESKRLEDVECFLIFLDMARSDF